MRSLTQERVPETPTPMEDAFARHSRGKLVLRKARHGFLVSAWGWALPLFAFGKRGMDSFLALLLFATTSPLILLFAAMIRLQKKSVFVREARIGRSGDVFQIVEFNTESKWGKFLARFGLHRLPTLTNVLLGDLSLVGPRPLRPGELSLRARAVRKRSSIRPGLLSPWWLRKRANIDFGSELEVDLEYLDRRSPGVDLGIVLRSVPALFYGQASNDSPDKVEILGIGIRNFSMEEALQYILDTARSSKPEQLCFVNTDCINKAQSNADYSRCLREAATVLADGIGIRVAGKILRQPIRQNVNGTDMFPLLNARLEGSDLGLFFLGARPGIAEKVSEWTRQNFPRARVKGTHHGFFSAAEEPEVLKKINDSGAEILLVAFGAPRQDLWIAQNLPKLRVGLAMGVGGLFDFYSGQMPRAPQWLRELSLEWTYRLYQEPGRMWQRYLVGNFVFLYRVLLSAVTCRSKQARAAGVRG